MVLTYCLWKIALDISLLRHYLKQGIVIHAKWPQNYGISINKN